MYNSMGAAPKIPGRVLVGEDETHWFYRGVSGLGFFGFVTKIAKAAVGAVKGAVRGVVGSPAAREAAREGARGGLSPAERARLDRFYSDQAAAEARRRAREAATAARTPLLIGGALLGALLLLRMK